MSHSSDSDERPPTHRPYRIAFCITELDPGGAERQLVQLVTHLDRRLFEPEVIALSGEGELVEPLRKAGIPVTCLNARRRWDARVALRLLRHFRRSRPDIVQTFLFHANMAGRIAARLARVPRVVCGIRVAERQKRWRLKLDRVTDTLVDRHVCVSRDVAEFSRREGQLGAEKLVVIPNAIDAASFAGMAPADLTEFGFRPDDQVILFVGRLVEQKDPLRLLWAFKELAGEFPRATVLFVGRGPLESQLRAEAAAITERVCIAGQRADIPGLMKSATCLALPSRWEGMPNVVLEAMAVGLPVVATTAEGVRELIGADGALGTVVHGESSSDFAAGIRQVLSDLHGSVLKAQKAQHVVHQQHMVLTMTKSYQRLYLDLLADVHVSAPSGGFGLSENALEKKP